MSDVAIEDLAKTATIDGDMVSIVCSCGKVCAGEITGPIFNEKHLAWKRKAMAETVAEMVLGHAASGHPPILNPKWLVALQ